MKERGVALLIPLAALSGLLVGVLGGVVVLKNKGQAKDAVEQGLGETSDAAAKAKSILDGGDKVAVAELDDASVLGSNAIEQTDNPSPVVSATIRFDIQPAEVMDVPTTKVFFDEEPIVGDVTKLVLSEGSRTVSLAIEAEGYSRFEKIYNIEGSRVLSIALSPEDNDSADNSKIVRPKKNRNNKTKNTKDPKSGKPKGPGGLIDL